MMTKEQIARKTDLLKITKPAKSFSVYGTVFLGSRVYAVEQYVKQNPSDKFYIWLLKNYKYVDL